MEEKPEDEIKGHKLRFVCVTSMNEDQEVILASQDKEGKWLEYGTAVLRSPFITEWLPARPDTLHIVVREGGILRSLCQFTYPADASRLLVLLASDAEQKSYKAQVIDPDKLKYQAGTMLLVNSSSHPAEVALGGFQTQIKSGQLMVVESKPDPNGMYRMLVGYRNATQQSVTCFDRYVWENPQGRCLTFLLPDPKLGLRVFCLSEFGPFE